MKLVLLVSVPAVLCSPAFARPGSLIQQAVNDSFFEEIISKLDEDKGKEGRRVLAGLRKCKHGYEESTELGGSSEEDDTESGDEIGQCQRVDGAYMISDSRIICKPRRPKIGGLTDVDDGPELHVIRKDDIDEELPEQLPKTELACSGGISCSGQKKQNEQILVSSPDDA